MKEKIFMAVFSLSILVTSFVGAPLVEASVANGLISQWKLDENSGTVVHDAVGTNTLNFSGTPAWVAGKFGSALNFAGNSNVQIPSNSTLTPANVTMSFWMKSNGVQEDWATPIMKGDGGSAPYASYRFEFNGSSDTQMLLHLGMTDSTVAAVENTTPILANRWYHVVGTYDGTTARFYLNGLLEGENNTGGRTIKHDATPLTVGSANGYSFFNGVLDDVRIYNRALTAPEVQSIYWESFIPDVPVTKTVAVTYPVNNQKVYNATTINADATSDVGVAGVQFKVDGANLGSEDTTAPYAVNFTPSSLSAGNHTVSATLRSTNGVLTNSSNVTVNVTAPQSTYTVSSSIFLNPERGFFRATGDWLPTSPDLSYVRSGGDTLYRPYIRLDAYKTSALPQSLLNSLTTNFQKARTAGIKVIPRFAYNFGNDTDASESQITSHIQQLAPVLQANVDVISSVETGFVGYWGEWHDSTNNLNDINGKSTILSAILAAVPASRMVELRYPYDLEALHGPAITAAEAYSGSDRARVGNHQDCFLASTDDWGTWGIKGQTVQYDKDYIAANGKYSVVGGETCNVNPPRSSCAVALSELESMHWSYINEEFEPTVIQGWKDQGCFDEINRRLGYRYELGESYYPTAANPGDAFPIQFNVKNTGYAALFNQRTAYAVLKNTTTGNTYSFNLSADSRLWAAGTTSSISQTLTLPANIVTGIYNMYLWLPDAAASLQSDARYAIQLGNQNVWDAATGYNLLASGINIGSVPPPPPPPPPPTPPGVPTGSPANGATNVSVSGPFTWSATGADCYDLWSGPDVNSLQELIHCTTATSTIPNPPLPYSTTLYWKVVATNTGGSTSSPIWSFTTQPQTPTCPGPGTNAFTGCYYNGLNFNTYVGTRTDSYPLNFDWGSASPMAGVNADQFSVRWDGNFTFSAGTYTFTTTSDDGIRVYVDNQLVVNQWTDHGATVFTGTKTLTAGVHDVKVEYYDNAYDAVAKVSWAIAPSAIQVFADSFEVSEWNNLWTEDAQNDWDRLNQRATAGTWSAEVDGAATNSTLTSSVINLQGKTSATITYSWYIENTLDAGEYVSMETSTNNGSTWVEKARIRGNVDPEDSWQNVSVNLTGINNLRIRFRATMSDATEDADVDNVVIMAQ